MAEKMIRCLEGHFYDPSKHGSCPWCALPQDSPFEQEMPPERLGGLELPPMPPPAFRATAGRFDPVVGWLVCLEGPDRGKDYRLHMEKNYLGRSPAMDVVIEGDKTVSREKHGVVIFDPKRRAFWVLPGEAAGLVYLNGEIVHSPTPLQRDDVIEIGQTKLVLIPFCSEKYNWSAAIA